MNFQESIKTCFTKYLDFNGRASRSEFWWWFLFYVLAAIALFIISPTLQLLFGLGMFLPSIAAAARRLHDTDRSGWWQLLGLIPLIGGIVLIVFLAQHSGPSNRFGEPA